MPWTLCSKDNVQALQPCQPSELRDEWSDEVEAFIRQHLGQPYLGLSQSILDEWHDGDGTHIFHVKKPPIISVDSLRINDVPLTPADYVVFDSYIELRSQVFPKGILNVCVSYTSGSTEVNEVVRLTAAAMIVAILNYRRRWGADGSIKWGAAEQKAGEESPNYNVGLTSHLTTIMKRLLRRPKVKAR